MEVSGLLKKSMKANLIEILNITDGIQSFDHCVLRFHKCNHENPCPLHNRVKAIRKNLIHQLSGVTISDLINNAHPVKLENISSYFGE